MKKLVVVMLMAMAIAVGSVAPVLAQTDTASACSEGLTPGYWKNHLDAWEGYGPYVCFHEVFGVGPHMTQLAVLKTGGGGQNAFNRHAVAALNNAASDLDFYSWDWVMDIVQDAYETENWEYYKNILEDANEMGVAGD